LIKVKSEVNTRPVGTLLERNSRLLILVKLQNPKFASAAHASDANLSSGRRDGATKAVDSKHWRGGVF
jgi:hypothetical protein